MDPNACGRTRSGARTRARTRTRTSSTSVRSLPSRSRATGAASAPTSTSTPTSSSTPPLASTSSSAANPAGRPSHPPSRRRTPGTARPGAGARHQRVANDKCAASALAAGPNRRQLLAGTGDGGLGHARQTTDARMARCRELRIRLGSITARSSRRSRPSPSPSHTCSGTHHHTRAIVALVIAAVTKLAHRCRGVRSCGTTRSRGLVHVWRPRWRGRRDVALGRQCCHGVAHN